MIGHWKPAIVGLGLGVATFLGAGESTAWAQGAALSPATLSFLKTLKHVAEPGIRPGDSADDENGAWTACVEAAAIAERSHEMPADLLYAVTLTETGRRAPDGASLEPWPWTLNVAGKGYRYATKAEAVAAARQFMAQGARSMDVGCAQINLKFHPRAFESMETAFDPVINLDYAATLLARHRSERNTWQAAVARYHSGTRSYGANYAEKVFAFWSEVKERRAKGAEARVAFNTP